MKSKLYSVSNFTPTALVSELEQFFQAQQHRTQSVLIASGYLIQAQRESTFSNILGQSSALTVKLVVGVDSVEVEVGSAKWIDKAAVGVIGYVILPVLAIIPIIGAYNQYKLSEDVWNIIDSHMARSRATSQKGWEERSSWQKGVDNSCGFCGRHLLPKAAFCSGCGMPVSKTTPECSSCGKINELDARFCMSCGGKL